MNLSPESAKVILEQMVKEGTISEADIEDMVLSLPTTSMKRATDLAHTLFCKGSHELTTDPDFCPYTVEEQMDTCWNDSEHHNWLRFTTQLMAMLRVTTDRELASMIEVTKSANSILTALSMNNPSAYELLLFIKGWKRLAIDNKTSVIY